MKDLVVLTAERIADEDHKILLGYIEDLADAAAAGESREAVIGILDSLVRRAEGHFEGEEQLMRIYGYPEIARHQREHEFFLEKVMALRLLVQKGVTVDMLSAAASLRDWISEHIHGADDRTVEFLEERRCNKDQKPGPLAEVRMSFKVKGDHSPS